MIETIRNAWKIPDLRKKLMYTVLLLIVFRFGTVIPVPGISTGALSSLFQLGGGGGTLFDLMDLMTGGALGNASIFAMGITPYINASIIMQLLTVAIPALERLQKEGEEGRKVIAAYQRYGTVVLALIQAVGLYFLLKTGGGTQQAQSMLESTGFVPALTIVATFTAGTAFLMWLGEQITEKGVGNGISLIIFAGIVSRLPQMIYGLYQNTVLSGQWVTTLAVIVIGLAVLALVVAMNEAERRIPVQYAKRQVGRKTYGGQSTHIPIKVAAAGVIPIIFAMSIMSFPSTISAFFGADKGTGWWAKVLSVLAPTHWFYGILYFLMILFFTYFYVAIQYNPIEMANNMKKNGGFIPGIRPGKPTIEFIMKVLNKITLGGAVFLGFIATFPIFMTQMSRQGVGIAGFSIGGTSLLIVVGVALETVKQIESQMLMRHYKGFLE